jgi:hypothetical protein
MNFNERRTDTRINIRVPLLFRILNNASSPKQTAESENISRRGIFFAMDSPLKVGTALEVSLRMPQELAGPTVSDVKCVARVVRIQPNSFLGGKAGIGLHIERYEAATKKERGAS